MTIQELKQGDFFTVQSEENTNTYKFISECMPNVYAAELNKNIIEFETGIKVKKIEGYQLYLMQGGRDWD
jgi:hypothetical protein